MAIKSAVATFPPITASGLRFAIAFPVLALIVTRLMRRPLATHRQGRVLLIVTLRLLHRPLRADEPWQRRDPLRPAPCCSPPWRCSSSLPGANARRPVTAGRPAPGGRARRDRRPDREPDRVRRRRPSTRLFALITAATCTRSSTSCQARTRRDQSAHPQCAPDGPGRRRALRRRPRSSIPTPGHQITSLHRDPLSRRDRLCRRLPRLLPAAAPPQPG